MREIKVRGYATEEMVFSQWMYGIGVSEVKFSEDYAKQVGRSSNYHLMTDSGWIRVHEESVGQYTGLKDKIGTEVYEKDVLGLGAHIDMAVEYYEGCFVGVSTNKTQRINWRPIPLVDLIEKGYEVIGNIYENPELLEADTQ